MVLSFTNIYDHGMPTFTFGFTHVFQSDLLNFYCLYFSELVGGISFFTHYIEVYGIQLKQGRYERFIHGPWVFQVAVKVKGSTGNEEKPSLFEIFNLTRAPFVEKTVHDSTLDHVWRNILDISLNIFVN